MKRPITLILSLALILTLAGCAALGPVAPMTPEPTVRVTPRPSFAPAVEPYAWIPDLSGEGLELETRWYSVSCAAGEDTIAFTAPGLSEQKPGPEGYGRVSFNGKNYSFQRSTSEDGRVYLTLYGDPPGYGCYIVAQSSREVEPTAEILAAYYENPYTPPEGYESTGVEWFAGYAKESAVKEHYSEGKLYVTVWLEQFGEWLFDKEERGDNELHREADGLEWYATSHDDHHWEGADGELLIMYCRVDGLVVMLLGKAYEDVFPLTELVTPEMARVFADSIAEAMDNSY